MTFEWHDMADEQPTEERANYVVLGNRGGMYLASSFHVTSGGKGMFYVPNNRSGYVGFDKVKAWALVPEYREEA